MLMKSTSGVNFPNPLAQSTNAPVIVALLFQFQQAKIQPILSEHTTWSSAQLFCFTLYAMRQYKTTSVKAAHKTIIESTPGDVLSGEKIKHGKLGRT